MITNAVRMGVRRVALTGRSARFAQNQRSMCKVAPHLREEQERFQQNPHLHGADNPTYLKGGTEDYVANIIAGVLVFTGLYKISNGLYNMSFGVNVLEIQ